MNPETKADLIPTIVQVGGSGGPAALDRLADKLVSQGVTRGDLHAAYAVLSEDEGHATPVARRSMDVAMHNGSVLAIARRRHGAAAPPTRGERERATRTNTAHATRMAEMMAEGIGREDALRYEDGGYFHERIVGDLKDPQDIGTEQRMDPWDVVQMASAWAQRFGGGTDALRARFTTTVESCRVCARTLKEPARTDMLNRGERFARYLEGVAVKQPAQEATT